MKKIRFTVVLAIMLSVSLVGGVAVQADTTTVTVTLGAPTGTRTLSGIASSTVLVTSSTSASASFSVSAVEVLANGVDWSVIAVSSNFAKTGGGSPIAAANFAYAQGAPGSRTVTGAGSLVGTINAGTSGALSTEQTLFSVSGETDGAFPGYTGTYTGVGTVTLTLPAGTATGVYTATVTITLLA